MENKTKAINSTSRPVPSSPGANQVTIQGTKAMKGSKELSQSIPTENLVPAGSSKKC